MLRAESVSINFFFFFFFFTKPILKRVVGVDNFLSSELLTIISTVFLLYFLLIIFFFEVEICDIAKLPEKFDIQRQLRRNNAPDVKDKSFRQQG